MNRLAKLYAKAVVVTMPRYETGSGALPENIKYAVKCSLLLSFLESVPEVSAKLREPITKEQKFEDVDASWTRQSEQLTMLGPKQADGETGIHIFGGKDRRYKQYRAEIVNCSD